MWRPNVTDMPLNPQFIWCPLFFCSCTQTMGRWCVWHNQEAMALGKVLLHKCNRSLVGGPWDLIQILHTTYLDPPSAFTFRPHPIAQPTSPNCPTPPPTNEPDHGSIRALRSTSCTWCILCALQLLPLSPTLTQKTSPNRPNLPSMNPTIDSSKGQVAQIYLVHIVHVISLVPHPAFIIHQIPPWKPHQLPISPSLKTQPLIQRTCPSAVLYWHYSKTLPLPNTMVK